MRLATFVALPLLLMASTAPAGPFECENKSPRRLTANASGASRVVVIAKSGLLTVKGRSAADVTVNGFACASDKSILDEIKVVARRDGADLVIQVLIPETMALFNWTDARLDLEVGVPENLPVTIKDGSGGTRIENVASLVVSDGSGELDIRGVRGDVEVKDGSGEISIRDVGGNVGLNDGSGSIEIAQIGGSVRIHVDGSGSIDVRDVKGGFRVDRDGSGGVDYERVSGPVSIPRD